ncbi:MAG: hypothetical protein DRP63_06955 [Planctomycetota bacterium]|nr:MAG: hypothetical protein DRP63_06955 [Planctomycetota bacterium]
MRRYAGVFISVAVIVAVLLFGMVRNSPRLREDIGADRVASLKARLDGLTKRVEQLRNAVCDIMDEMDRLKATLWRRTSHTEGLSTEMPNRGGSSSIVERNIPQRARLPVTAERVTKNPIQVLSVHATAVKVGMTREQEFRYYQILKVFRQRLHQLEQAIDAGMKHLSGDERRQIYRKELEELTRQTRGEVLTILTPEQRERYKRMFKNNLWP